MSDDCPTCGGRDLPVGSRFCPFCGCRLGAYTPEHLTREVLDKGDTLRGERKEVTVLFADVVDSLAMAAALDPEDVHALMDGFFALSLEAIHLERGTVNQFRGDGFMALFGAPHAQGEDAARALRAALEIRSRAASYSESIRARYGFPLALRLGVNTGHVWVGSIGGQLRKDYTAEGPAVGLAARLQGMPRPARFWWARRRSAAVADTSSSPTGASGRCAASPERCRSSSFSQPAATRAASASSARAG